MEYALSVVGAVFDALGILASLIAVVVHCVLWANAAKALKADGDAEFVIPAARFKRWARVNAGMALLVGLNLVRWFVLSDIPKLRGGTVTTGSIDDATWAVCDVLLIVMPIILICNMRAVLRGKESARG